MWLNEYLHHVVAIVCVGCIGIVFLKSVSEAGFSVTMTARMKSLCSALTIL